MFEKIANDIYKTLITLVVPVIVGIIILRKEIVLLLSSKDYLSATTSLGLLSIALFFCMGAWFWGQCILVPLNNENTVFKVTVFSALVNIILNFIMIPILKENAAAITTILAEAISFIWCSHVGRSYVKIKSIFSHYIKVLCGCISICLLSLCVHSYTSNTIINILIMIPASVVLYFTIETILRNESVIDIITSINNKLKMNTLH